MSPFDFWNAFTLSLVIIGTAAILGAAGLLTYGLYRLATAALAGSLLGVLLAALSHTIEEGGNLAGKALRAVWTFLVVNPISLVIKGLGTFCQLLEEFGGLSLVVLLWLAVLSLPFVAMAQTVAPLAITLGTAAAGVVVGLALAPIAVWKARAQGLVKALGSGLLTIVGSAYGAVFLIALLIALGSD
jgi:hypothetical protein